jgi:hypothetical protein
MSLYARLGRRQAALRQYQLCVDALKRELNARPEAETIHLYQQISERAHLAAAPRATAPTNLPASSSELIDRETETRDVGFGGAAPARDADRHRGHRQDAARRGGRASPVAGLRRRRLVSRARAALRSQPRPVSVAVALKLALPDRAESPDRVAAALGAKRLLLVLDNCEHVIDAAARMAEAVLRAAPHTRIVATSREPLRAPGEYVYRVPPLEVPREDTDDREEAAQDRRRSLVRRPAASGGRSFLAGRANRGDHRARSVDASMGSRSPSSWRRLGPPRSG